MNKTRLLTSMAVFGVFSIPAMADIASNAESATCDSGTIGVSSGSTVLEALWTAQTKNCDAGTYLNSATANCTPCPAGSFCAGGDYTFDGSNVGLTGTCPTDYTSDASAESQSECYRACTTSDVAHSTSVSGRYYYGDNNECEPTGCETGYSNIVDLTQYITAENIGGNAYCGKRDYYSSVYGVGSLSGESCGLTENNTWKTDLGFGTFYGNASCNATPGSMDSNGDHRSVSAPDSMSRNDTSGRYCWCQLTDYENTNGGKSSAISSWVFAAIYSDYAANTYDESSNCSEKCSANCAQLLRFHSNSMFYQGFRYQLFRTSNTTIAVDECKTNTYACNAGTYLDNSTETCVTCPSGSYCSGGIFTYNGNDQGISGSCPSEYPLSDSAASVNDCYRSCETTDVANTLSVSGKYYYGNNNKCEPVTCVTGYTSKPGFDFSTVYDSSYEATSYRCKSNSGTGFNSSDTTGLENGEWDATFSYGTVKGQSRCSDNKGAFAIPGTPSNTEGKYCWCAITGFRENGLSSWIELSSPWMFNYNIWDAYGCMYSCASYCSHYVRSSTGFRSALFGSVEKIPDSCSANTITIDWYNLGSLLQTNSCTYGQSDIVIPEVPERTGYDFGGWKVVE